MPTLQLLGEPQDILAFLDGFHFLSVAEKSGEIAKLKEQPFVIKSFGVAPRGLGLASPR